MGITPAKALLLFLPTVCILYGFSIPATPRSVLYRETFSNEREWLDIYYDVNPRGWLRPVSEPVHFTGFLVRDDGEYKVEGWQTLENGKPRLTCFSAPHQEFTCPPPRQE